MSRKLARFIFLPSFCFCLGLQNYLESLHDATYVLGAWLSWICLKLLPLDMKKFIGVLMIAKLGFIANEAVTPLKLLDKGLNKEDMALSVLIDFPFQILFGYYAAKWSSGKEPLRPVC